MSVQTQTTGPHVLIFSVSCHVVIPAPGLETAVINHHLTLFCGKIVGVIIAKCGEERQIVYNTISSCQRGQLQQIAGIEWRDGDEILVLVFGF